MKGRKIYLQPLTNDRSVNDEAGKRKRKSGSGAHDKLDMSGQMNSNNNINLYCCMML